MLSFEPTHHVYKLDGVELPSVTQILSDCSLTPWYPDADRKILFEPWTAVHKACELLGDWTAGSSAD